MARLITLTLFISFLLSSISCAQNDEIEPENSVLLFTKTEGWRHASIEAGAMAVKKLGQENGFSVTWTEDSYSFSDENLANYDAVIFLNTTLDVLDNEEQNAFENYIQNGGGFVGMHAAADTEYDWPWYGDLVGGWFNSHPSNPNVREATVLLVDGDHPSTEHLSEEWNRADEWYNYKYFNEDTNTLLELDTDSYEGSEHPGDHPIAWYHEYDGGRAFYTGLGHTEESFSEEAYLRHILGGIQYAMGITDAE